MDSIDKKNMKKREGFALIITLIGLALMSILGIAIMGITLSNAKMAKLDSQSQVAYYIAEAGVTHTIDKIKNDLKINPIVVSSAEAFFDEFEDFYTVGSFKFDDFEDNFGVKPEVKTKIEPIDNEGNPRDYRIKSSGTIANSKKVVETTITIKFSQAKPLIDNLLYYTQSLFFNGTEMIGENGTIVNDGILPTHLNGGAKVSVSNIFFNGPVTINAGGSIGNQSYPGTIYINGGFKTSGGRKLYGDVRVKGNAVLKDAKIDGNLFVEGDLHLGYGTPEITGTIEYTGNLTTDYYNNIIGPDIRIKQVESVQQWKSPVRELSLRDDSWYSSEKGYNTPGSNKFYVDNYNSTSWKAEFENVVIVSKGDINIGQIGKFNGVLIAPNGKVTTGWIGDFTGVIIAENGIFANGGGVTLNLKYLQDYFDEYNVPVIFEFPDSENDSELNEISLTVKSPIREK